MEWRAGGGFVTLGHGDVLQVTPPAPVNLLTPQPTNPPVSDQHMAAHRLSKKMYKQSPNPKNYRKSKIYKI